MTGRDDRTFDPDARPRPDQPPVDADFQSSLDKAAGEGPNKR